MKANNIYNKLAVTVLAAASLFTVSCNEDETLPRQGKPTVTVGTNNIATEGFDALLDLRLSYAITNPAQLKIEIVGGTATKDVDYTVNMDLLEDAAGQYWGPTNDNTYILHVDAAGVSNEFPAYSTQYNLRTNFISIIEDNIVDQDETIEIRISSVAQSNVIVDELHTITIKELAPTTLDFTLDYDGEMTIDGNPFDKCNLDFDLLVSDVVTGNPYAEAFYTIHYDACNETFSTGLFNDYATPIGGPLNNNTADWADGSIYSVYADYWSDNALLPAITTHEDIPMDIVFTKVKGGAISNLTLSFTNLYNTADTTSENDPSQIIGINRVASIEIIGDKYLITNEITGELTIF